MRQVLEQGQCVRLHVLIHIDVEHLKIVVFLKLWCQASGLEVLHLSNQCY